MVLRRKNSGGEPSTPVPRDIPATLAPLVARATPVKIVNVDIDQPLPDIRAEDNYRDAYVVLSRDGVCLGDVMVSLTPGETSIHDRLRAAIAHLRATMVEAPAHRVVPDSELPHITVVVPSIVVRLDALRRCLDSLGELDYPSYDVVLVDNRSWRPDDDPLTDVIAGRTWLRVVHQTSPGVSAARNAGVATATAEIIAFADDDVRVDPQWLRAIATRFVLDPQIDIVTGLILPAELESPAQVWYERYYGGFNGTRSFVSVTLSTEHHAGPVLRRSRMAVRDAMGAVKERIAVYGVGAYAAGASMAFRRSALERVGGFDEALGTGTVARGGEDLSTMISVLWTGGELCYEPLAVTYHQHRREYSDLLRMLDGNGLGFTAMLTGLVLKDPRHAIGLASEVSSVVRKFAVQGTQKLRGITPVGDADRPGRPGYPPMLARREFRAFLFGPAAYIRSRAIRRRLNATRTDQ
ncbi:MAG: glycosyltransferase [Acidimicrobiales bacterium]